MSLGYARSASSASWIEFVREDAHGNRDGDAFDAEERRELFSSRDGPRKRRVRQPGDRDVVEDVVAREPSDSLLKTREIIS